jgi:CHAD domain-containing protein
VSAAPGIRDLALGQMNQLLTRLTFEIHRAAKTPGPEEIHDVRVSIRRFSQALLLFKDLFPPREVKKIKRRLKRMLRLTSEIRNRDITLEYLASVKVTRHRPHLVRQRLALQKEFSQMAQRWNARDSSAHWRIGLSLGNS